MRVGWLTFFERMVDLRGYEQTMIDIISESDLFFEVKERPLYLVADVHNADPSLKVE